MTTHSISMLYPLFVTRPETYLSIWSVLHLMNSDRLDESPTMELVFKIVSYHHHGLLYVFFLLPKGETSTPTTNRDENLGIFSMSSFD